MTDRRELDAAWAKLSEAFSRVERCAGRVAVDIGDDRIALADCNTGSLEFAAAAPENVDCTVTVTPAALHLLMEGSLDPRVGELRPNMMSVSGSIAAATEFCDKLAGRDLKSVIPARDLCPKPTTDRQQVWRDLNEYGYAIVKDALSPDQLQRLRTRLDEQAEAERERGLADRDQGVPGSEDQPNQRVWSLFNKGDVFLDLLNHPVLDDVVTPLLGEHALLSTFAANIANPGGRPMILHTDQGMVRPPLKAFPIGLNVFFFLDDFSKANGGTRVLPGSHKPGIAPMNIFSTEETIAAEGPAGSALLFESRLWHGTGANTTSHPRRAIIVYFVRSWVRPYENMTLSVRPEILEKASDRIKTMFGLRVTNYAGAVDGIQPSKEGTIIRRDVECVPELRPAHR